MCLKLLKYNVSTQVYNGSEQIISAPWINAFTIHNTGTTNVINEGDVISPGGSKTVGGNYGEIYDGRIIIMFQTPTPAPPVVTNLCVVIQKFYTNIEKA